MVGLGSSTNGHFTSFSNGLQASITQSATNGHGGKINAAPAVSTAPLTTTNLAQHTEPKASYVQPPATADERLMQAKNFLSDQDVNSINKFRDHHWEIECLLRTLSDEKIPCDSGLFRRVQDMLRVHQARMDRLENPIAEPVDSKRLVPYSTRLPTQDPAGIEAARNALRKEDHAPFTIDRKPDHDQFVRAFRSNDKFGQSLREVERGAYFQTLKDPSLASEYLKETTYEERAFKRGRRRAALQLALRTIASNEEQTFYDGPVHRVVSLPQAPTKRTEEPRMCQALSKSERPTEPDRFAWTKKNIQFQHDQKQLETWINGERAQIRASLREPSGASSALTHLPAEPVMFYKPTQKQCIVAHRRERRVARLVRVAFEMIARLSYDHISNAMEDTQAPSSPEARVIIWALKRGLIDSDANNTRDVSTATQIEGLQQYEKIGGQLLHNKSDDDFPKSPLDDAQLDRLGACSMQNLSEPDDDTRTLLQTLRIELLSLVSELETGHHKNYSEGDMIRGKEALKSFREDVATKSSALRAQERDLSLRELANPLNSIEISSRAGQARTLVTDQILAENNEDLRDHRLELSKIWSFSTTLSELSRAQNYFSMEKWPIRSQSVTTTLAATQTATAKRKASTALETTVESKRPRDEYTTRATDGKRKKTTDAEHASSPKRSAYAADYPSLDPTDPRPSRRLAPEEIGFHVVKEKSNEKVPRTGGSMPLEIKDFNVMKRGQILENAPDPREKRFKGEARFPFGETSTTWAAMNMQIEMETRHSKTPLPKRLLTEDRH